MDNVLNLEEDVHNGSASVEAPSRIIQSLETQLTNLHAGGDNISFTEVRRDIAVAARSVNEQFFNSDVTFGSFFNTDDRELLELLNASDIDIFKGVGSSKQDNLKTSITIPSSVLDGISYSKSRRTTNVPCDWSLVIHQQE